MLLNQCTWITYIIAFFKMIRVLKQRRLIIRLNWSTMKQLVLVSLMMRVVNIMSMIGWNLQGIIHISVSTILSLNKQKFILLVTSLFNKQLFYLIFCSQQILIIVATTAAIVLSCLAIVFCYRRHKKGKVYLLSD